MGDLSPDVLSPEPDFPGFFVASELDGRCQFGTPRRTVLQLLQLADLFILPSTSETYSLVVHEAMLAGSLVVLNEDLQPMTELFDGFARYLPFPAPGIDPRSSVPGKD